MRMIFEDENGKEVSDIEKIDKEIITKVTEDSPERWDEDAGDAFLLTKEEEQLPNDEDEGLVAGWWWSWKGKPTKHKRKEEDMEPEDATVFLFREH